MNEFINIGNASKLSMYSKLMAILAILMFFVSFAFGQNSKHLSSDGGAGMEDEDWLEVGGLAPAPNVGEAYHVGKALVGASTFLDGSIKFEVQGGSYLMRNHSESGLPYISSFQNDSPLNPWGITGAGFFDGNSMYTQRTDGSVGSFYMTAIFGDNLYNWTGVYDKGPGNFYEAVATVNASTGTIGYNQQITDGATGNTQGLNITPVSFSATTDEGGGPEELVIKSELSGGQYIFKVNLEGISGNNSDIYMDESITYIQHDNSGAPLARISMQNDIILNSADIYITNDLDDNAALTKVAGRNAGTGQLQEIDLADIATAINQTLSLNASGVLSISGGNSVALAPLLPSGTNVGAGTGLIFRNVTGTPPNNLNFKSLVAGTNISIVNGADDITINAGGGGSPDGVLSALALATATLNATLTLGGPVSVDLSPLLPLAANLGAGEGVWATITGSPANTLNFKSLVAGANVSITSTGTEVTINSTAGGGVMDFTDLADTPGAYAGASTYFVMVNAGETALEFNPSNTMLYLEDENNIMTSSGAWSLGYGEVLEVRNGLNTEVNLVDPWRGEIEWGGDLDKNTIIDHITGDYSASFVGDPRIIIGDNNVWPANTGDGLIIGEDNTVTTVTAGFIHGITVGKDHIVTTPGAVQNAWSYVFGQAVSVDSYRDAFIYGDNTFLVGTTNNTERAAILGDVGSTFDAITGGGILALGTSDADVDIDYGGNPDFYTIGLIMADDATADNQTGSVSEGQGRLISILSYSDDYDANNMGGSGAGQRGQAAFINTIDNTLTSTDTDYGQHTVINTEDVTIATLTGENRSAFVNVWNNSIFDQSTASSATLIGCETCSATQLNTAEVVIIGGFNNHFDGTTVLGMHDGSVIVGGNGINPTADDGNTVFVPNLSIDNGVGTSTTPASSVDASGVPGQFMARQIGASWFLLYKIDVANWGRVLLDTSW